MSRRFVVAVLVLLVPPALKPMVLRRLSSARIGRNVRIGWASTVSAGGLTISDHATIGSFSIIRCGGEVRIGAYSIISSMTLIYGSADLRIGDHSYIGPQSLLNVEENVTIGNYTGIGPRSMLFTHGVWFPFTEGYVANFGAIEIGDRVWCAAGVFIHPGVKIADDVFVNSMSVVRRNIPSGQMVEGNPAAPFATIDRLRRPISSAARKAAIVQMLDRFASTLARERGIRSSRTADGIEFKWSRQRYLVLIDPSDDFMAAGASDARTIVLDPSGRSSGLAPQIMVFDFHAYTTTLHRDPVHRELRDFFHSHYGVDFEYRDSDGGSGQTPWPRR